MTFYTLFTPTENVHLIKDVGMYPESLAKYEGVDAHLVCYKNGEYPYLGHEVKNLKLDFIDKKYGDIIDGMKFIKNNATKIDVLNVYHLNLSSFFYIRTFKKYKNKSAISYLKLDADMREINRLSGAGVIQWIKKKTIEWADVVTAESRLLKDRLNEIIGDEKIQYLPDGIDIDNVEGSVLPAEEKENIILTVGRLGSEQKNTQLLVDEFIKQAKGNYRLWLVGSITEEFNVWLCQRIARLKEQNHVAAQMIEYKGEVSDRQELDSIYKKAKIFALSSKWESFGIVLVEALWQGCYLMTTKEVPSTPDLMRDIDSFEAGSQEYIDRARKRVQEEFSYKVISHKLMEMLVDK